MNEDIVMNTFSTVEIAEKAEHWAVPYTITKHTVAVKLLLYCLR